MIFTQHYESPLGGILLAADDTGLTGLWFEGQKYFARTLDAVHQEQETAVLSEARRWLDVYFGGQEPDFTPPLHPAGSAFQQEVWALLRRIPCGQTTTYGALAKRLAAERGLSRMSAQAVGGAVGHNVISIIIPCHRVVGTLDIEHAIKHGEKKFEPGILAQANRNILYVDEINLLDDHVVDVLLDAAAMGVNTVEREGVSYSHPARFVLVGTMNPEEGDIRPQLLDRFGLSVVVTGEHDPLQRVEVIKRRLAYENDAESFITGYKEAQEELAEKIIAAGKLLPEVTIDDKLLETVAKLSVELGVDGHRADITVIKTALTLAAFNGRKQANLDDLKEAAKLVLPHRMRRRPFEEGELRYKPLSPYVCTTISILGRPNSADGINRKSVTRFIPSRTGATPSIYIACAKVAPSVSINSPAQKV